MFERQKLVPIVQKNTILNVSVEHNKPAHKSEPTQHIEKHFEHLFGWSILCNASSNNQIKKNVEALFIGNMKPHLNKKN